MNSAFPIYTPKGRTYFQSMEIIRLEASSNYTIVYLTQQRKYLTSKVLKSYAPMLEEQGFIRANRSHLVNPEYIHSIHKDGLIQLKDETTIQISRAKKRQFKLSISKS